MVYPVQYFDGQSSKRHKATLELLGDVIQVTHEAGQQEWDFTGAKEASERNNSAVLILEHLDHGDARVIIEDAELIAQLRRAIPGLSRRSVGRRAIRKVVFWGGAAVASVLLILFVIIPGLADQLAKQIPITREVSLGQRAMSQVEWILGGRNREDGTLTCTDPAGLAALDKMTARISRGLNTEYALDIRVFDHEMVNAFAVPGGHIVLFDGLLQAADSPEEVAGVLAHEIGHVIHRDSTRLMLRSAGSVGILGMVFGDFAGGAVALTIAERLMSASYTQEAETNADLVAHQLLNAADLPVSNFAGFFRKLADEVGETPPLLSHLASHPDLGARADAAIAADKIGNSPFVPVLEPQEWQALQGVCKDKIRPDAPDPAIAD